MSPGRSIRVAVMLLAALVALLAVGARMLLRTQAATARRRIGTPFGEHALAADRVWGRSPSGPPIELLMLGDSLAAGLGAEKRKQTLGGRIAKSLANRLGQPVRLRTAAVVGSESHALAGQLDALPLDYRADVAVIVVGGNDVIHLIPPRRAAHHLERAIRRLEGAGSAVVVGTCPDLGALRAVPQPLRALVSLLSRRMAAAQNRAIRRTGASSVGLRHEVGPIFRAAPGEMFSLDQFHPSPSGYRRTADALLPAILTALAAETWSDRDVVRR